MSVYNFYEYSFGNNFDTGLTVTAKSSPAKLRQQQRGDQQSSGVASAQTSHAHTQGWLAHLTSPFHLNHVFVSRLMFSSG